MIRLFWLLRCVALWLTFKEKKKMPSIEEVLDSAGNVFKARDTRRVEVDQATAAVEKSLREQGEADAANVSEDDAIAKFKEAAINFGKEGTGPTIEDVLVFAQAVFEARGKRVIEVDEAVAAASVAIREQAEADSANMSEDEAIAAFKDKAAAYTKE